MPTLIPQTCPALRAAPIEVASGLRGEDGLVFLDTARADRGSPEARFSILAARPLQIIEGNIFNRRDRELLRRIYQANCQPAASTPDLGFPLAGLYGAIEYEGDFRFGDYREVLVYDHEGDRWIEQGSLSRLALRMPEREIRDVENSAGLNFSPQAAAKQYEAAVRTAQDYIAAGDIYQVNLTHRFLADTDQSIDPFAYYEGLRSCSPTPHAAFLDQGKRQIASSSPEQFLSISGSTIKTRPIKGTRPRFNDPEQDEKSAYDLRTSSKENAELIMITDLQRNDIGQICDFGTVKATELLKLERYEQVFHLVSTVQGELREDIDPIEAFHACFPGGSITGAPKKRAREIISELESEPRGLYTGAIGCFGYNGESRFNIAIRTAIFEEGQAHFHVGAGIVADSDPTAEWEETLHKAAGLLEAARKG
ncbi:MAG: aminodeoxychorismate synthase component I [Verrucomicrobiota bacterium]